jgi:ATPase subunit of ABC transporter with duplicated ATPase domains
MNVLDAQGIRKSFGRRRVLAGVDLAIEAGEMAAVVGENGSGKSTLPRILAGDLRPDAGRVLASGRLGYCPQAVVLDTERLIICPECVLEPLTASGLRTHLTRDACAFGTGWSRRG